MASSSDVASSDETSSDMDLPTASTKRRLELSEPICLRCAKCLDKHESYECNKKPHARCARCALQMGACDPVPAEGIKELNTLLSLRRKIESGDGSDEIQERLTLGNKDWTKKVEALLRAKRKHGLRHRPRNPMDVGLAMLEKMDRVISTLDSIYDVLQAKTERKKGRKHH